MTDSASSLLAILVGLGVFALIVGVGWRSVQNRRILRMRAADGKETIIVAHEEDEISSIDTATTTKVTETSQPGPAPGPSDLP